MSEDRLFKTSQGDFPSDRQYVLCYLKNKNWNDSDDPSENRYWVVAKFVRGLSKSDRESLSDSDWRKTHIRPEDEHGNNLAPYCWAEFGPAKHFGQDVDFWMPLPQVAA